jgi:hypothetical protein
MVVERRYDPRQWLLTSSLASDLTTDWVWDRVHCSIPQKGYLGLSSRVWLFFAVWIWRGSEADLCLQFRDKGVEAASIVKTYRGNDIYTNLFWSLGFIFAVDAMLAWCTYLFPVVVWCCCYSLDVIATCCCLFVSCYGLSCYWCYIVCYLLLFVCFLLWVDVAAGVYLFTTCSWLFVHAGNIRG